MSKKNRILIAEDEDALRTLLKYNLEKEGYDVIEAADGDEAIQHLNERLPDVLLVDWMMPGASGIEVCRHIRQKPESRGLPIIMLTARGEESDRIRGLDMGADDYLIKPFAITELLARVRAVMRRMRPAVSEDIIEYGDITVDRTTRRVKRNDRNIPMGPREFALFTTLLETPGKVYSREALLNMIWGQSKDVDERTVDVHIGRLRKILNEQGDRDPIRTVRAAGYAIDENYMAD
ncbi:MAG: two-component system phosphate regulon response regulator PhoB [Alphaproteobacteria bacterium]|jgi:two-component system phosphate regulon response regulator PhoB